MSGVTLPKSLCKWFSLIEIGSPSSLSYKLGLPHQRFCTQLDPFTLTTNFHVLFWLHPAVR